MSYAIGIDLGTTYSCVAVWMNDHVKVIPNDFGNRTTPSYVTITDEILVGEASKNQCSINPSNTLFDVKRLIGRTLDDLTIQEDIRNYPFTLVSDMQNKVMIKINKSTMSPPLEQICTPEQISSFILSKMKDISENYLKTPIKDAVITVPAYFNDAQRQATKNAGLIANLNVLRIINEPTAAAIAYGFNMDCDKKILVFDFGGGTLDVTIIDLSHGVFEVKSTAGDTHLGGEDITHRLMKYCEEKMCNAKICNTHTCNAQSHNLQIKCDNAKKILSNTTQTEIEISNFIIPITRDTIEGLCVDIFEKCIDVVKDALLSAKMVTTDIDEILLIGGSSRIPKIRELLSNHFNGKKLCQSVNPDEAVACGAAIQAAILTGKYTLNNIILLDITPVDLGIETAGGLMEVIISKNTTLPTKKQNIFTTYHDNQTKVSVKVYEGLRTLTKDNNQLGCFILDGIPPMPKGVPKIEITYDVDTNGILKVSAKETSYGSEKNITINNNNHLTKEQIEIMIDEANKLRDEDLLHKEKIKLTMQFENFLNDVDSSQFDARLNNIYNDAIEWFEWFSENQSSVGIENFKAKFNEYQSELLPPKQI